MNNTGFSQLSQIYHQVTTWLRITLSYCVIGALVATLLSAYFQEANTVLIILVMATALGFGVYFAEITRRKSGLENYKKKLLKQKHLQF
jgi:uncharacterized membrane protein